MRKLLIAAFFVLSSACTVYDTIEEPRYMAPPPGAVYVEPGLWYVDVNVGRTQHRHYYRYGGPSEGYRYYYHLHQRGRR